MQQHETQPYDRLRPFAWYGHVEFGRFALALSLKRKDDLFQPPTVYNRVAVLRREHGVTREELASALHIHLSTLEALENGSYLPSLRLALDIGAFFQLPIESLFTSAETECLV